MKRFLSVSFVAMLAMSPMIASADPAAFSGEGSAPMATSAGPYAISGAVDGDTTNVVTASYVKGAYNDAIRAINKVSSVKQNQLKNNASGTPAINDSVLTAVRPATGTAGQIADDTHLVTEKAVRDAIVSVSGDVSGKQAQLKSGAANGSNMEAVVVDYATGIAATSSASDTKLASEKAISKALDERLQYDNSGTMTKVNSTVVTTIAATNSASDANLASEKAIATALDGKQVKFTNGATGANANTAINAAVQTTVRDSSNATDNDFATEKAIRSAIDTAVTGMVTTSGAQTLTDKTIDADDNTISDLETDNFKSGVIQTSVRAVASAADTSLATEKAVATALEGKQGAFTNGAAQNYTIDTDVQTTVRTVAGGASDQKLATEKAIATAIASGTATLTNKTIDVASGNGNTISNLGTGNFASGTVQTSVRAANTIGANNNTTLVSELAVRNALDAQRINILATWGSDESTQTTLGTAQ